jgi:nicotinamidase-related amidase
MRVPRIILAFCALAPLLIAPKPAPAETIIEEWGSVKPPPPPQIESVTLDPKTTALLMLDVIHQTCNETRRPRCVASLPAIKKILTAARDKKMLVVYSLIPHASPSDIWAEVAPMPGDPLVTGKLDKFIRSDLEKILADKGIKTVVAVGTAAHGAILNTAAGAVQRDLKVVVPVDTLSADNTYIEQFVVWDLVNAPEMKGNVTLTKSDMLKF